MELNLYVFVALLMIYNLEKNNNQSIKQKTNEEETVQVFKHLVNYEKFQQPIHLR